MAWLVRAVATFGFVGLLPLAPATWASAVTLALWLLIPPPGWAARVAIVVAVGAVGVWAAGRAEGIYSHDDRRIVIDEVAGSLVAVAGFAPKLSLAVAAFVLFRLFDIVKPPPIYQLQALPGGAGVMADDLAAGIAANVCLRILVHAAPNL